MTARRRAAAHARWTDWLAEIVGAIPPESVAVVALDEREGVTWVASIDRRACLLQEVARAFAESVRCQCLAARVTRCAIVSVTDEPLSWECEAAQSLRGLLEHDVQVVDALVVTGSRYRSPGCADPQCCPPGGRRLPRGAPERRVAGGPSASAIAGAERVSARRAGARSRTRRDKDPMAWRMSLHGQWDKALARCRDEASSPWDAADLLEAPLLGRLGEALTDAAVRDAIILQVFGAPPRAVHATLSGERSDESDACLEQVMRGARRPESDRVEVLDAILIRIEYVCAGRAAAEASAVRALLSWWWGDLASCLASATAAVTLDQECRLGALLCETAVRGMLPGWLRVSG